MATPPYEYEFKLLGSKTSLREVFESLVGNTTQTAPSDRYVFDTVYLDTADSKFASAGYSLRYRDKQGKFASCMELKELSGEELGISKRVELGKRNGLFTELFLRLMKDQCTPPELRSTTLSDISEQFKTVVDRTEHTCMKQLGGITYDLELALDSIFYLRRGTAVGPEHELEIEVKDSTSTDMTPLVTWLNTVVPSTVQQTIVSKADRGRKTFSL